MPLRPVSILFILCTLVSASLISWREIKLKHQRSSDAPEKPLKLIPRIFEPSMHFTPAGRKAQTAAKKYLVWMYVFFVLALVSQCVGV